MRCKNMCCISILADPRAKLRVTCFENGRENGINLQDSHRKIFSNMLSTTKSISKYELRDIVNPKGSLLCMWSCLCVIWKMKNIIKFAYIPKNFVVVLHVLLLRSLLISDEGGWWTTAKNLDFDGVTTGVTAVVVVVDLLSFWPMSSADY